MKRRPESGKARTPVRRAYFLGVAHPFESRPNRVEVAGTRQAADVVEEPVRAPVPLYRVGATGVNNTIQSIENWL